MDWMKIGYALLLLAMIAFVWPRAKQMLRDGPKAKPGDWASVVLPFVAVVGLVVLLMSLV